MVEIALDISRHCIERELKFLYEKKVREYFRKIGDMDILEKEIDLLAYLLKRVDFPSLRTYLSHLEGKVGIEKIFLVGEVGEDAYLYIYPERDKGPLKIFFREFFLSAIF